MATNFVCNNTVANGSAIAAHCSGNSNNTGDTESNQATIDGTAGSTERSLAVDASAADLNGYWVELNDLTGYDGASGNWTVPLTVSTTNHNVTWDEVWICHVDSSYAAKNTLGGNTAIGKALSSSPASETVNQGSSVSIAAGDKIIVIYAFDNGKSSAQTIGITPDFTIVGPGSIATVFTGTGAIVLGGIQVSAAGAQEYPGAGAIALDPVTVLAQGAQAQVATAAITLPLISISGRGVRRRTMVNIAASAQQIFDGTAALSLQAISISASGSTVAAVGTGALTLSAITLSADGVQAQEGAGALTLDTIVLDATGVQTFAGTGSLTLSQATIAATAVMQPDGSGALTLSDITMAATAAVAQFVGTGTITLSAAQLLAQGLQTFVGDGALTLPAATIAAQGVQTIDGTAVISLSAIMMSGAGEQGGAIGTGSMVLLGPSVLAQGVQIIDGAGVLTLLGATISATGVMQPSSTGAITLPLLILTASGLQPSGTRRMISILAQGAASQPSAAHITLNAIQISASATMEPSGTGAITLPLITLAGTVDVTIAGRRMIRIEAFSGIQESGGILTLFAPTISANAVATPGGIASVALSPITMSGSGTQTLAGPSGQIVLGHEISLWLDWMQPVGDWMGSGQYAPIYITATAAQTLAANTGVIALTAAQVSASGFMRPDGVGALTLSAPTIAAQGVSVFEASGDIVLDQVTIVAQGVQDFPSTAVLDLSQVVLQGDGVMAAAATGSIVLDTIVLDGTGVWTGATADGTIVLTSITLNAQAVMFAAGAGTITIMPLELVGQGVQAVPAAAHLTLSSPVIFTAFGVVGAKEGAGALTLQAPQISATGIHEITGAGAIVLDQVVPLGFSPDIQITGQIVLQPIVIEFYQGRKSVVGVTLVTLFDAILGLSTLPLDDSAGFEATVVDELNRYTIIGDSDSDDGGELVDSIPPVPGPAFNLLDGLVAYWKLDEATGSTRMDSVGNNHLLDTNNVTQQAGHLVNAAGFVAASSQDLHHADQSDLRFGEADWTVAFWFMVDDVSPIQILLSKDALAGNGREINIGYLGSSASAHKQEILVSVYDINDTDIYSVFSAPNIITPGVWTWLVCWYTAKTVFLQIDNKPPISVPVAGTLQTSTAAFYLGQRGAPAQRYFTGKLDGVAKWARILSAEERAELYNNGAGLDYPF